MKSIPVRVGILGCSDIAGRKFLPALQNAQGAVLSAVASRCRERAERFAGFRGCRVHSYDSLLADSDIDLIYLSLPNHLHEEWTIAALEQGKHVICEKPLGLDPDSVERMLRIADQRGLLLYENLMFLHHPLHLAVRECLDRIGEIRLMRAGFGFPFSAVDNFRMDPLMGGGSFHDQARYPLGAALFFLRGEIGNFRGIALSRKGLTIGMHGTALSSAREIFQFSLDFGLQYEAFYELVGKQGRIRVDRAFTTPADLAVTVQVMCGSEDHSFSVPPDDHFRLMIEHVCRLIGGTGEISGEHRRSRRIAMLAERMRLGCIETEAD